MTLKLICSFLLALVTASAQFWGGPGKPYQDILSYDKPPGVTAHAKAEYQNVAGGATYTVLNYSGGPGYVAGWWFGITSTDVDAREGSLLKISIDGEASPSINVKIIDWHAFNWAAGSHNGYRAALIGAQSNKTDNLGYSSDIPIPFSSGVKVELQNGDAATALTLWGTITYYTGVSNTWSRTRRLRVANGDATYAPDTVVTLVNQSARGRFLGLYALLDCPAANFYCFEGNVKIYLDGAASPTIEWSGTEDYFENSNYFEGGEIVAPYLGTPMKDSVGYAAGAYRFHVPDPIMFNTALRVTLNVGDTTQRAYAGNARLNYVLWYYTE